jgi:hypothetical protein
LLFQNKIKTFQIQPAPLHHTPISAPSRRELPVSLRAPAATVVRVPSAPLPVVHFGTE